MNLRSLLTFGDRTPEALATQPTLFPLQREIERMFGDIRFGMPGLFPNTPMPRMDVVEKDGHIEVTAELPGLERDDIRIELADDLLLISGEKRQEKEETQGARKVTERSYGAFSRALELPAGTKSEDIEARMEKGVLTLKLPKPALKQPEAKRIEIKAG